jgi:hypothetical protein
MKQRLQIVVLAVMIMAALFSTQMFGQYPIEGGSPWC